MDLLNNSILSAFLIKVAASPIQYAPEALSALMSSVRGKTGKEGIEFLGNKLTRREALYNTRNEANFGKYLNKQNVHHLSFKDAATANPNEYTRNFNIKSKVAQNTPYNSTQTPGAPPTTMWRAGQTRKFEFSGNPFLRQKTTGQKVMSGAGSVLKPIGVGAGLTGLAVAGGGAAAFASNPYGYSQPQQ